MEALAIHSITIYFNTRTKRNNTMNISNFYFLILDIETSKEMEYDEKLEKEMPTKVWLSYGVVELADINGKIHSRLRFRSWTELDSYLKRICKGFNRKIFCFVHNLSYEFDFIIKNLSKPKNFICNSTHNVISATLEDYRIEFRCTYQLSKLPLKKIGEMYNLPKLDSEYRTIYPEDEITEEEWVYCERDCDILIPYIIDEVKSYRMLSMLPLTSTGKVRRRLQELLKTYENTDWDLMPPADCYEALSKVFKGGLTLSNPRFTNKIIEHRIKSFDEKSKYPGVMLSERYPRKIEKLEHFDDETIKQTEFWIAKVKITDLYSNFEWGTLSIHNCEDINLFTTDHFNGKIINSKEVTLYINNIDLEQIKLVYYFKNIEFIEFYRCYDVDYLPEPFIKLIIEFAEDKTKLNKELKVVEETYGENSQQYMEKFREYMESKAKLNGIYGMMVQKLVPQEFYIDELFMWHEKNGAYKEIKGKHLKRNFLFGIFITSYSRYDLSLAIVTNCPTNFVYCDTDSIKFIDTGKEFIETNKSVPEYLQVYDSVKSFNKFEEETPYDKFLTFGAKKYCYYRKGKFNFVVAGLPKVTVINSMDEFKLGTTFKDCKLAKRYIYNNTVTDVDMISNQIINQYYDEYNNSQGGVALFETDYKLNMTINDLNYIKFNDSQWNKKNEMEGFNFVRIHN